MKYLNNSERLPYGLQIKNQEAMMNFKLSLLKQTSKYNTISQIYFYVKKEKDMKITYLNFLKENEIDLFKKSE